VQHHRAKRRSGLALGTVCFFVLLLASSAPHRVHHLFDDLRWSQANIEEPVVSAHKHAHTSNRPEADDADHEHDHRSEGSAKADCVAQGVAQHSHITPAQAIEFGYLELESKPKPAVTLSWHYHFSPSLLPTRASTGLNCSFLSSE
jgi:hypothetical protein